MEIEKSQVLNDLNTIAAIRHVLRGGAEGARCRELEGDRSGEVRCRAVTSIRSILRQTPIVAQLEPLIKV